VNATPHAESLSRPLAPSLASTKRSATRRGIIVGCLASAFAFGLVVVMVAVPGGLSRFLGQVGSSLALSRAAAPAALMAGRSALLAVGGYRQTADPGRLVGPLALLLDSAASHAGPAARWGTIRHRYRQLSYQVLTPLAGLAAGAVTAGEVVVVEDGDDDAATAIVYRFAPDGTVVASAPTGDLLGSFDPTTPAYRNELRAATGQRILISGRE